MSNTKHTPLPWSVATSHHPYTAEYLKNKVWGPEGPGHGTVCETNRTLAGYADADRIVACVNGCKDLNPEAFAECVHALDSFTRGMNAAEDRGEKSVDISRLNYHRSRMKEAIANARNMEAGR